MSSTAFLSFADREGIRLADWDTFAAANGLTFDPHVVGGITYRHQEHPVLVDFGSPQFIQPRTPDGAIDFAAIRPPSEAQLVTFSTYWLDKACLFVAELAVAAWLRFGGSFDASPEIKRHIRVVGAQPTTHRCRGCRAPRHVDRHEATNHSDIARGVRTYLWGRWAVCGSCGDRGEPELVVDDTDLLTRPL